MSRCFAIAIFVTVLLRDSLADAHEHSVLMMAFNVKFSSKCVLPLFVDSNKISEFYSCAKCLICYVFSSKIKCNKNLLYTLF